MASSKLAITIAFYFGNESSGRMAKSFLIFTKTNQCLKKPFMSSGKPLVAGEFTSSNFYFGKLKHPGLYASAIVHSFWIY